MTLLELPGIQSIRNFPWVEAPAPAALTRSVSLLRDLGALNDQGQLSALGRRMAAFPLPPRYARMLLAAQEFRCVRAVCHIVALAQGRDLLLPLQDKRQAAEREEMLGEAESDLFPRLTAFGMARKQSFNIAFCRKWGIHAQAARQADRAASQFLAIAEAQGLDTSAGPMDETAVRRCLLAGFSDQLAKRDNRGTLRCSLIHGRRGELRRDSAVRHAPLIVAAEIDEIETRGEATVFLSLATAVEEAWLEEQFPEDWFEGDEDTWDHAQKRVVRNYVIRFRDLTLEAKERGGTPDPARAAEMLATQLRMGKIHLKAWNDQVEAWIARVNFAARHCPELGIAELDAEGRALIAEQMCEGCLSQKDLDRADVWPPLKAWLSTEQLMALDTLVPETFPLPRRRRPVALRYEDDRVIISSKLQDFYDVEPARLTICNGRVPLTCELLAPSGRPAQITDDLANFWKSSYANVKKDLQGRYPKHEWR